MSEDQNFLNDLLPGLITSDGPSSPNMFHPIDRAVAREVDQKLDAEDAIALTFLIVEKTTIALQLAAAIEKLNKNSFTHEKYQLGIVECLVLSAEKNKARPWEMKLYQALYLLDHHRLLYDLGVEEEEAVDRFKCASYIKPYRAVLFKLCQDLDIKENDQLLSMLSTKLGLAPVSSLFELKLLHWMGQTLNPLCQDVMWGLEQMQRADLISGFKQNRCGNKDCQVHKIPQLEDEGPELEYYPRGPGLCIIINQKLFYKNTKFPDSVRLEDRLGTDRDRDELQVTFTFFGAECVIKDNLARDEMVNFLGDIATKANNQKYFWVTVCILSHGRRINGVDQVLGCDGMGMDRKEIINVFANTSRCPNLQKKPKLFIFQACRASEQIRGELPTPTPTTPTYISSDCSVPTKGGWPVLSDYMVASATVEDFVSFRSTIEGSFFIRHLCKVMQDHGHHKSLQDLMTIVLRKVAEYRQDYPSMPETNSTMTKKFMFQRTKDSMIVGANMMIRNTLFNTLQNEWLTSKASVNYVNE